jgi:urocanate hydratase
MVLQELWGSTVATRHNIIIDEIPGRNRQAAAIIHMILNNLDSRVAQFPQELVTYGGNGQVFSNWAQVSVSILTLIYVSIV